MHSNTSQTAEIMRSTVHTVFEEEENNLPNCAVLGWGGGGFTNLCNSPQQDILVLFYLIFIIYDNVFKGIVSQDFRWFQIILKDRSKLLGVPLDA